MAIGTRPRARGLNYRPRRPVRPTRRPAPRGRTPGSRWTPKLWLALGVVAALVIASPWLIPVVIDAVEGSLNLLGIGLLIIVAGLTVDTWLALKQPLPLTRTFWRIMGGVHLLLVTLLGILGVIRPSWGIGDVAFAESSMGGEVGRALLGEPVGVIVWLIATLTGLSLIWPRGARLSGTATLALARYSSEALRSFLSSLIPRGEEEEAEALDRPFVATWDEEYSPLEIGTGAAPSIVVEEVKTLKKADGKGVEDEPVIVTSEPLEKPTAYRQALPMGRPAGHGWELPPLELLSEVSDREGRQLDNEARAQLIIETLKSFGVDASVVSINQGPTVTQFGLEPGWEIKTRTVLERDAKGRPVSDKDSQPKYRTEVTSRTRVRVNQITSLANDLALALAAPTIRIEAPVPGRPVVGIEVPNTITSLVTLRSVMESTAFQRMTARSKLALGLGKGVSGEPVATDLARMPHLLIAGATGSGKSVCMNALITGLLMHNHPRGHALHPHRPQAGRTGYLRRYPSPGFLPRYHRGR